MKYQLADLHNGPFGEEFLTLEEAHKDYNEVVKAGAEINQKWGGMPYDEALEKANSFFLIVTVDE